MIPNSPEYLQQAVYEMYRQSYLLQQQEAASRSVCATLVNGNDS